MRTLVMTCRDFSQACVPPAVVQRLEEEHRQLEMLRTALIPDSGGHCRGYISQLPLRLARDRGQSIVVETDSGQTVTRGD